MSSPSIDLDSYLSRIGYRGDRSPTLATLRALHERHAQAIPFENLNPLMGWPVLLDVSAVQQKLLREGRGGYCFEHNTLFSSVLQAIGFDVTDLAARVLWGSPEDTMGPRTHMLLRVVLGGVDYIADVGFGGQTLTGPLRLEMDVAQPTPHELFRLVRVGPDFKLQVQLGDTWKSVYRFDLQRQFPPDYAIANYYLYTNPASHFRNSLRVALPAPGRRYALLNNQFSIHQAGGETQKRILTSVGEVKALLTETFGLAVPKTPELDAAITRVCGFGG